MVFVLLLCLVLPTAAGAAPRITSVASSVTGEQLPPLVQQRMQDSVRIIGEQVLLDQPGRDGYP